MRHANQDRARGRFIVAGNRYSVFRWLPRALASIRRRRKDDSAGQDCVTLLGGVLADLASLNRSSERDFLTIGGKLAEFVGAARQISSDMAALGELISGGYKASGMLTRVSSDPGKSKLGPRPAIARWRGYEMSRARLGTLFEDSRTRSRYSECSGR